MKKFFGKFLLVILAAFFMVGANGIAEAAEPDLQVKDVRIQDCTSGEVISDGLPLRSDNEYLVAVDVRREALEAVELKIEFSSVIGAGGDGGLIRVSLLRKGTAAAQPGAEANLFVSAEEKDLLLEYVPGSLDYALFEMDNSELSGLTVMRAVGDAADSEGVNVLRLECDGGKKDGLKAGTWQTLKFKLRTYGWADWQSKFKERNAEPLQVTALGLIPAGKMAIYAPKIEDLWQLNEAQPENSMYVEPDWSEKALDAAGNLSATELHLTMAVDLPSWVDELRKVAKDDSAEEPYLTFDLAVGKDGLLKSVMQVVTSDSDRILADPIDQSWQVDELKGLSLKALAATGWTTAAENKNGYAWSANNSYSILTGIWANVDQMWNLPMLATQVEDDGEVIGVLLSTRVSLAEFTGDRIYITYVL